LNPALPVELEQIVNKELEKDPELRYQSAKDLVTDLKRLRFTLSMQEPPRVTTSRKWDAWALGAVVVIGLVSAGYFLWRRVPRSATPPSGKIMLAVLPFENLSGDPEQEYFSDGITEEMISRLGNLQPERLGVIARTSAMAYKKSKKQVNEIARELGVDYLLEGSVRRSPDRVRITAQLIQARDQTHLWAESAGVFLAVHAVNASTGASRQRGGTAIAA
jgi:TolB-like protein